MVSAIDPTEDLSASDSPPMRAMGVAVKAALVKIHYVGFAVLGDPKT
jgi:hypothetical protein